METKRKTLAEVFLLSLFAICLAGCSKDEESNEGVIIPSVENILFSGEGDSVLISFVNENWEIAAIASPDKSVRIWGDIYNLDGKLVRAETQLGLEGLGRLESKWLDHGFVITRSNLKSLTVEALENSNEKDFSFVIMLTSGTETKDILVKQGKSAGYSFEQIEYTLIPESYKVTRCENGHFTFNMHERTDFANVKYNPFQNQYNNYTFTSETPQTFAWTRNAELTVEIPGGVWDGALFYNHKRILYQNSTAKLPLEFSVGDVEIKTPPGSSKCHFDLEYEEYQATYRIFAKNRTTGKEKVFEGVFKSSCPNGSYKLVWDSENKPKE